MSYPDVALRSESAPTFVAPVDWVGDMVAAYLNKTDYTTSNPKADGLSPKRKLADLKSDVSMHRT